MTEDEIIFSSDLDRYLWNLQKNQGAGAIALFAGRLGIDRVTLWRFRKGKRKPCKATRLKIKRLTFGAVLPESFK